MDNKDTNKQESSQLYKKYIGIKSIFYFCSLPLRVDTYKGCSHNCVYCFSQVLNNRKENFFSKIIPADIDHFTGLMSSVFIKKDGRYSSAIRSCLQRRVPIHLGCLSDPFQPIEKNLKVTKAFLEVLEKYNYPCVISTKSDIICSSEYLSIIKKIPSSVQFSFSTLNDDLALRLEPNASSPSSRLESLKEIASQGIQTVFRLQPFLFPFEQIDENLFITLSKSGVKHIVLEHLRIPTNSKLSVRDKLSKILGKDIIEEYKKLGIKYSRVNYELDSPIKLPNIEKAIKLAHKYKMSFGSGDNDFHHFSDNLCCCGPLKEDNNYHLYEGHLGKIAFNSKRTGNVNTKVLEKEWQPDGSIREYLNSDCRLDGLSTISDYLKLKLSNPNSSNSLKSFYGIKYSEKSGYYLSDTVNGNKSN